MVDFALHVKKIKGKDRIIANREKKISELEEKNKKLTELLNECEKDIVDARKKLVINNYGYVFEKLLKLEKKIKEF